MQMHTHTFTRSHTQHTNISSIHGVHIARDEQNTSQFKWRARPDFVDGVVPVKIDNCPLENSLAFSLLTFSLSKCEIIDKKWSIWHKLQSTQMPWRSVSQENPYFHYDIVQCIEVSERVRETRTHKCRNSLNARRKAKKKNQIKPAQLAATAVWTQYNVYHHLSASFLLLPIAAICQRIDSTERWRFLSSPPSPPPSRLFSFCIHTILLLLFQVLNRTLALDSVANICLGLCVCVRKRPNDRVCVCVFVFNCQPAATVESN